MGDPLRLYGLKALVTNAADGIGEAVARTLIKHGANVVAADVSNSGVVQHFQNVKGIDGLFADLREPGRMPAMIEDAVKILGGIDILVTEFPLAPAEPLTATGDELERLLQHRADLTLGISRAALPHLKKSPSGRIINIGFLQSHFGSGGDQARDKAEQDLAAITRALAAETGEFGITANYVQPGAIMTPASREMFRRNPGLRDYCISNSAAGRVGEPVDVAKVVLFLASDDAMFVSGTGIAVDGGRAGK